MEKYIFNTDCFLFTNLTRQILTEKFPYKVKQFITKGWKFSGIISIDIFESHNCDLCKKDIGVVYYNNANSNKCLTLCSKCDTSVSGWKKLLYI